MVHTFAVQNTGDVDLRISNLVTSCGCTVAKLTNDVIPPGQRADLMVTFDADFHPTSGETTRLVWFATNDPAQPWVRCASMSTYDRELTVARASKSSQIILNSMPCSIGRRLCPRGAIQLAQDAADIVAHRSFAQVQCIADLPIGFSLGDAGQNLHFARVLKCFALCPASQGAHSAIR